MQRRKFLKLAGSASVVGGVLPVVSGLNRVAAADNGSIGFGDMTIDILRDGDMELPLGFLLPDSIDPDQRSAFLARHQLTGSSLVQDCNVTLLRSGDRTVLFDVGGGLNFMPTLGLLTDALADRGVDPSDVTDVVFTHAHPDHLWGLLDDFDDLLYSEAAFHINRLEWDYWSAEDTLGKTPDNRKTFVVGAQNRFAVLEDRIQFFGYGDEVIAGVEALDTHGHTPGHTSFAIHSGSDSIVLVGDAITNVMISFENPGWPSGSDQDREAGASSRKSLLDRLANDKSRVIGFHFPHPGVGTVETDGNAYRYVAL